MSIKRQPSGPSELARDLAAASTAREAEAAIRNRLEASPNRRTRSETRNALHPSPEVIGIWRRSGLKSATTYVRDPTLDDENFWAGMEQIGPKTRTRAVLLGESVARGAFLDPLFNCASALGTYLDALCGAGEVEIVDLARSGLTAARLLQMTAESVALAPDVLVIFAGNNWRLPPTALDCDGIAALLEAGGSWSDVGSYFRDALRRQVANLMFALSQSACAHKIPILFVVPANDVRDTRWRSEWHDPLFATAEQVWVENDLANAEALLAAEKYPEARDVVARIIDIDPMLSARALQICGLCALALGDKAEAARRFGEMEDACLYLPLSGLLTCGPTLSGAIHTSAEAEGIATIDLRKVFLDATEGALPNRDLFLDQVHMTPEGIRLAMAAVTERLLPMLGRPATPYTKVLEIPVHIDPLAAAQGHFIAALLHGGRKQGDVAAYHAAQSIRHSSEMAILMQSMMRMMLSQTPESYHEAYARIANASARFPGLRLVLYRIPLAAAQPVYVELARALAAAADIVIPGTREECERLLRQTVLRKGRTNLLPYAIRREDSVSSWGAERSHVRSFTACTEFRLRCAASRDLCLEITARRGKGRPYDANASLLINGCMVHRWEVKPTWARTSCIVPAPLLREGLNDVCILWPDPCLTRSDRVKELIESFRAWPLDESGFAKELFPVYGDVYSFDVSMEPVRQDTGSANVEHAFQLPPEAETSRA